MKEMKGSRFYTWFYPCWCVFRQLALLPCCSIPLPWIKVRVLLQVRALVTLTFHIARLSPTCFCKRLFSKISQNFQLTLARVFISIKNDAHISGSWIHSIKCSKGLFRKKSKWQLRCFTLTWVSTFNIMKEKIGDRGFSYSKMKSNFWPNAMLSNFTNQLVYKAHALGRGTPFLTMK